MSNEIDEILKQIYSIERIAQLSDLYDKLWKTLREKIYKLDSFRSSKTGLKISSIFTYNNKFIWNTKDNIISDRKIYTPFKNNIIKLRNLYSKYIKEINLLSNNKLILENIKDIIIRTEVLVNMLYLYGWNINRMNNEKFDLFNICVDVYFSGDEKLLMDNMEKINKIKNINTKKINSITLDIVKEFKKVIIKSKKLF